jgi:GTP-binding protein Era
MVQKPKKKRAPRRKQLEAAAPVPTDGLLLRRPIEPVVGPKEDFRVGYVALIGRPNVGKSTILNQLLGQKIAATTHKPQTTRKNLLGILHPAGAQILLLDTPGYHRAEGPLNRYMIKQAKTAITEADVIGFVIEARQDGKILASNEQLAEELSKSNKPIIVLINKIDSLKKKDLLLSMIARATELIGVRLAAVVPISALRKVGLDDAVREIAHALPRGEPLFEEDEVTDQPERSIVAEFIREKVMLETREELPYKTAVTIDQFEDARPRLVRILGTIHVEKDSQKPILIGRRGERLKAIGTRARKDIEHFLGSRVYLDLKVRVTEGWSTTGPTMEMLGYGGGGSAR